MNDSDEICDQIDMLVSIAPSNDIVYNSLRNITRGIKDRVDKGDYKCSDLLDDIRTFIDSIEFFISIDNANRSVMECKKLYRYITKHIKNK